MTNVVKAALQYAASQGANQDTKWRIALINDAVLSGFIREVEGDIYALIKTGGDTQFFDASKVLYMWHNK